MPLELVPTFDVAKGQNQSIWCDMYIPKGTAPGVYSGSLTVTESGALTHSIPIQLTVRKFALPDVASAKTMLFRGDDSNKRYFAGSGPTDAQASLLRDRHFLLAHRHKISMIDGDDAATSDQPSAEWARRLDGSLFTAANGYAGPGVGTGNGVYSIGTYGSWSWKTSEADMWTHADAWATWFSAHAPDTDYFLYLADEPGSSQFPQLQQWASWIHADTGPGKALKSFSTVSLLDAQASMPDLDIVASAEYVGDPAKWLPAVATISADPTKRFWMYNGERPGQGTTDLEDDGIAMREISWGLFKRGITRHFEWESTYYDDFQGGSGETDVWNHAANFSGFPYKNDPIEGEWGTNHTNTNGLLFYPGTDLLFPTSGYNVAFPIASLRLKHWRRGIQDADYLTLATAKDSAAVTAIVQALVPKVLWEYGVDSTSDPTYVHTDISWSNNPDDWEAARAKLADLIEK
ncbi:MAG: glycoside hydrolase domain-containing protein [Polyangiales bacterium]